MFPHPTLTHTEPQVPRRGRGDNLSSLFTEAALVEYAILGIEQNLLMIFQNKEMKRKVIEKITEGKEEKQSLDTHTHTQIDTEEKRDSPPLSKKQINKK